MWEFYLAGSETAFRYQGLVVFQLQLAKRIDALPITRDYMLHDEQRLLRAGCDRSRARAWRASSAPPEPTIRRQAHFSRACA